MYTCQEIAEIKNRIIDYKMNSICPIKIIDKGM